MSFSTYYRAFISLIYTLTCQKLNKCESREEDSSSEYHVYGCSGELTLIILHTVSVPFYARDSRSVRTTSPILFESSF